MGAAPPCAVFLCRPINRATHHADFSSGAAAAALARKRESAAELIENVKSTRAMHIFCMQIDEGTHNSLYRLLPLLSFYFFWRRGAFFCSRSLSLFFATPFSISPRYYSLTQGCFHTLHVY